MIPSASHIRILSTHNRIGADGAGGYVIAGYVPHPPPPPPPPPAPRTVSVAAASHPVLVTTTTVASGSSSSGSGGRDLGTFEITCYALSGRTASGASTSTESAAVDPSVIPMGSHIYIAGVGNRVADDTGGAVNGHHIDIWEPSTSQCDSFGRQYHDVHLLS